MRGRGKEGGKEGGGEGGKDEQSSRRKYVVSGIKAG